MNYEWTPKEREIRDKVAALAKDGLPQDAELLESADLNKLKSLTAGLLGKLAGTGYMSTALGVSKRSEVNGLVPAMEEVSNISGSLLLAAESSARLFGGLVAEYAQPRVKEEILSGISAGALIGAVAISEPPDPPGEEPKRTVGVKDDDHYLVTGQKSFISNGPIADICAVMGLVGDEPAFFLVDMDADGLEKKERLCTLGYNGLAVGGLELNDVKVPAERVLGPFNSNEALDHCAYMQDLALTVACLGVIFRSMHWAKKHAQSHTREGKPVFYHQEVRFKFADMLTLYQTSQIMSYRAGWHYSVSHMEAETILRCAKVFAAEGSEEVSALAMQIMAGEGYIMGNPAERAYRESKYAAIAGTTSERARMKIAEEQLKKY